MPEARWLLPVTSAQLARLRANAEVLDELSDRQHFMTYYVTTIELFIGDRTALSGFANIECSTVVDGILGMVTPAQVTKVVAKLAKLDLAAIERQVSAATPKQLKKVDDFAMLTAAASESGKPAGRFVVHEISTLIAFYKKVAKDKGGVVMYTS